MSLLGILGLLAVASTAEASSGEANSLPQVVGGDVDSPETGPEAEPAQATPEDDRPRRLSELQTELFDLDLPSLEAAAASRRSSEPRMLIDAILLRAGRSIPPGVSAARRAQRAERASEAIDWLRRERTTQAGRELVDASLRAAFDFDAWQSGVKSRPLTKAAIGVVEQLELREWAPALARGLSPESAAGSEPGIRRCIQGALFQLFGRWYESKEQFDAAWPDLQGASAAALGLDVLMVAHERADKGAAALMEFAPAEVGPNPLGLFDPRAAAEVARAAGRAVAGGQLSPEEVIELLGRGIEKEVRPIPLHARVETMLDLVQGVDPDGPVAEGVRRAVLSIGQASPGASTVAADRSWIFLGALRRLHYPMRPTGDALRAEMLAAGTAVLTSLIQDPTEQPLDPDGLKGAISALTDLARSIADQELRASAARPLVLELYRLIGPETAEPIGVQRAAANGLRLSIDRADANGILRLLGGMHASDLEYELLGTLRAAISVLEPGSDEAEAVIAELFLAVAGADFDGRARALGVLLADGVRPALAARPRDVRSRWILQRLESETSPDLRRGLLDLLGRVGDRVTLEQLIERPALLELAMGDGAESVASLGNCLLQLGMGGGRASSSGEDVAPSESFSRAARAVAKIRHFGHATQARPARAFALREALRLMLAAGGGGETRGWSPADQAWTVRSTLELLRVGPPLGVQLLTPAEFRTILEAHVDPLVQRGLAGPNPGGPNSEDRLAFHVHALRALIQTRQTPEPVAAAPGAPDVPGDRAGHIESTLADFERAIQLCPHADPAGDDGAPAEAPSALVWTPMALELERIQFLQSSARFEAALVRFDGLWETSASALRSEEGARAYIELVSASPSPSLTPPRLARTLALLSSILDRASAGSPEGNPPPKFLGWLSPLLGPPADPTTPFRTALLKADGAPVLARLDALLGEDDTEGD